MGKFLTFAVLSSLVGGASAIRSEPHSAVLFPGTFPHESKQDVAAELQFKNFMQTYNVKYSTEDEYAKRLRIFKDNLSIIEELNAEHQPVTEFGVTKYADLSPSEFKDQMRCRHGNHTTNAEEYVVDYSKPRADSVDWTTKGAVTAVKDQGQCGSCWAFGTTGVVEGAWFLAGHDLTSLSEQELVSCDMTDSGCGGGLQSSALEWIIKKGGIAAEKRYSYVSGGGDAPECRRKKERPIAATISKWKEVPKKDAEALAVAVAEAPVTVAVNAGGSIFQFYRKGIMKASKRQCDPTQLDHAVLAVGYGTDGGEPYWKVKNSWNANWGEDGYFRIERGQDTCGIEADAQVAIV